MRRKDPAGLLLARDLDARCFTYRRCLPYLPYLALFGAHGWTSTLTSSLPPSLYHQGRTVAVKVVADMHMVGPPDERLLDSFTHEVEVGVRTQHACFACGAELDGTFLSRYTRLRAHLIIT